MKKDEFKKLYNQEVLKRNKKPYNFDADEEADVVIEAYNPLCGDKFNLYLNKEDSDIKSAHFHGFGCALSKASTSLLMELIEGRNKTEIVALCHSFLEAVDSGSSKRLQNEVQKVFAEMKNFEGRVDCVTLSWKALYDKMKNDED
ncbi:MAG: Fe-S cluster assembly sulfur transfer protein SufU [Bacteroidota bacterium]